MMQDMVVGIDASRVGLAEATGTERYSAEIIKRLIPLAGADNHRLVLYTKQPQNLLMDRQILKTRNSEIRAISLPRFWTQLGLAYRTWRDPVDCLWIPAHTLPLLRRGFGGLGRPLKTVVTIHGLEYEWLPEYENRLQRWYLPLSTQYAVKRADRIIAVSEFTKRELVNRLHADPEKIWVVREGVSRNFQLPIFNFQLILKKYKLQKQKYILFIGTVQPRKNLVRLIAAFSRLKGLGGQMKLVIAGKLGWGYEEVLAAPAKWRVEDRVVFTRYISDADRGILLRYATVYIQPSIVEGFGLPVLEAMAAGVPVVSSAGGALPEVVGEAGLVFDPRDVEGMSQKLAVAVTNISLTRELVKKGRERIRHFSWDEAARRTYNILTDW